MSKKEFECPSCSAPMKFSGGESIFQTCESCHAPIIVPTEIFYSKDQQILTSKFATLNNDVPVDPEQVTNELTPGDSLPKESEIIDPEAKIEKFEVYQEKIGTNAVAGKKHVDDIVAPDVRVPVKSRYETIVKAQEKEAEETALSRIKRELRTGDKIEAIKIYREAYGKSLVEAKEIVEAIEREELAIK